MKTRSIQGVTYIIAFVLFTAFYCAISVPKSIQAAELTSDSYTYREKDNNITIIKYDGKDSKVDIPNSINGKKVVAIDECAFSRNKNLTSVTVPSGVTTLGIGVFDSCENLQSVSLPDTLTSIGMFAFENCSSLVEVSLPDNVSFLDYCAFSGCTSLRKINIPDKVTNIPSSCFKDCVKLGNLSLPDSITQIYSEAFYGCKSLKTNFPAGLVNIDYMAFKGCESLDHVIFPDSLIRIGFEAFDGCTNMKTLKFGKHLGSIVLDAFDNCTNLIQVDLSDPLKTIPYFSGCSSLAKLNISETNSNLTSVDGVLYNKDKTVLLRYPPAKDKDSFTIPSSVVKICDYAFDSESGFASLKIPNTVSILGIGVFTNSPAIRKVTFPNKITTIPESFFYHTNIQTINIPNHIKELGYRAFAFCNQLEIIQLHSGISNITSSDREDLSAFTSRDHTNPFIGCDNLKAIKVDKNNKNYVSMNGVLYEKSDNSTLRLVAYPANKAVTNFTIPANTTAIDGDAFYNCQNLKKLYLPKKLTSIYDYFSHCNNLKIMVPSTVTNFPGEEHLCEWPIFYECTNCFLYVRPNSVAYQYCLKNEVPFKIWD